MTQRGPKSTVQHQLTKVQNRLPETKTVKLMNPEGLRSTPRGLITPRAQSPQLDSQTTKIDCQSPEMDYQTPNLGVKNRLPEAQNGILLA